MVVSLVAFIFLNFWPSFRNEYADTQLIAQNEENASNANSSNWSDSNASGLQKAEFLFLLSIQCFVCFVSNGAFPSIQTYSCLPYGNAVYHLRYGTVWKFENFAHSVEKLEIYCNLRKIP